MMGKQRKSPKKYVPTENFVNITKVVFEGMVKRRKMATKAIVSNTSNRISNEILGNSNTTLLPTDENPHSEQLTNFIQEVLTNSRRLDNFLDQLFVLSRTMRTSDSI